MRSAASSNGRHAAGPNISSVDQGRPLQDAAQPSGDREDFVERFDRACKGLGLKLDSSPVVVACSGGADSAAALLLLRRVAPDARLIACYVNHQIRPPESIARDLGAVRAQARAARAGVSVARAALESRTAGSPEERARSARYSILEAVARRRGAVLVVTGHQQDDVAETALLALARGSGIDGTSAMRPIRRLSDRIALARPLLWATKEQCRAFVNAQRLPVSEDETNADARIPRNAVRSMLASLEQSLPGAARAIARSSTLLADDKALLDAFSARAWQRAKIPESNDLSVAALRKLPLPLLRRVVRHAVAVSGAGLRNFSFAHCNAIANAIKGRRGGRYHAGSATVLLSSGKLAFEGPHDRKPDAFRPISLHVQTRRLTITTPLGTASLKLHTGARQGVKSGGKEKAQFLNWNSLRQAGRIELRLPKTGDVCTPAGRSRPVSLARYLGKAGVPRSRRGRVLLLCAGGRIAAVLGHRVMEPFRPKAKEPVLELGWFATDTQDTRAQCRS